MQINIVGKIFNKLSVVKSLDEFYCKHRLFECLCDCGKTTKATSQQLRCGTKKSCGCLKIETAKKINFSHGMSKTRIHNIWVSMIQRCTDKNNKAYKDYGGRGITVSPDWMEFNNFYRDMGEKPSGLTLDRTDNSKGYSKENCRWVSKKDQANNRRSSKMLTFNDETMTQAQWEDRLGYRKGLIYERLKRGWSIEKTLTTKMMIKFI